MQYSIFPKKANNALLEPMFLGNSVNVARYDQQKHSMFEKLIEKQLSFFWRPEEVDVSNDRNDYVNKLTNAERHVFISNLKYQTLLDSIQGRSPNVAFLPLISIPELETWVETWSFSETIHSRSYTHILRNILQDPSAEFDDIAEHPEIQKRAADVSVYYDDLIEYGMKYQLLGEGRHDVNGEQWEISKRELKKRLYLAMASVNVLESIRFYVSFACTFAFSERELMEGNAKIVRLIARDENLHKLSTQYMLNEFARGQDDPEMAEIAKECQPIVLKIFDDAVRQEKEWASYLFSEGSLLGLNERMLCDYTDYVADLSITQIGFEPRYGSNFNNPLPWMNGYLNSDNVQVAPQEAEIASYLVGQIDSSVSSDDFDDISL